MPAYSLQRGVFLLIPGNIPVELGLPELHVGLGHCRRLAPFVPMPEAAVDKNDRVPLWKHDVGMPRQFGRMQTVAEPQCMQVTAHDHLRLRVLRPNPAHHLAALFWGKGVHYSDFLKELEVYVVVFYDSFSQAYLVFSKFIHKGVAVHKVYLFFPRCTGFPLGFL